MSEYALYFLTRYAFIIFVWGGIGYVIYFVRKLITSRQEVVRVEVAKFLTALKWLLAFVVSGGFSFLDLGIMIGHPGLQLVVNLLTGVLFLMAIRKMLQSFDLTSRHN